MPPRDTAPASRSSLTNKCLISVKMGACGHVEYVVFLLLPYHEPISHGIGQIYWNYVQF